MAYKLQDYTELLNDRVSRSALPCRHETNIDAKMHGLGCFA